MTRIYWPVLLTCFLALVDHAGAAGEVEPVLKRLVLHDFDRREIKNNLRGYGGTWQKDPRDPDTAIAFVLDENVRRGDRGNALYLSYKLNPNRKAENGFWMNLNQLDATDYDHLEFWVKGDATQGFATLFKVEFKRPQKGSYEFMDKASFVVKGITDAWQRIRVPLNTMNGILDWTELEEFVIAFHARRADVHQGAYYIDDVALIKTGKPGPHVHDTVPVPNKDRWGEDYADADAVKKALHARLAGWPDVALADKAALPEEDRAFLERLARDTWAGLAALTDKKHGLPLDTLRFGERSVALEDSRIGDYTNVTNIGMYLLAISGAFELGIIEREEALKFLRATLASLELMERHRGFFYNYYDTTTLERTSNFISFVDSAWLTAGLMVSRGTFPELQERCTQLIEAGDYGIFYDDVEQLMWHGYYINLQYPSEYQYGCLFTEPRAGSLIAIGKGDVPEEHWFNMIRTFPEDYAWQSLKPVNRTTKTVRGHEVTGGYYEWEGNRYVPSWGGSLFEALMPTLVVDEMAWSPEGLGRNGKVHAEIHRKVAVEELGYPVWGMSPSSRTDKDGYGEFGVKVLGSRGYHPGVVTPHVSALALLATPDEAVSNLRELAARYDLYGPYGFYDAVDPVTGDVAYKYLALDQGMVFIALANYLGDHCIQKRFAADPIAAKALAILGEERFFDE